MNPDSVLFGAFIGVGGAVIGALVTGIITHCTSHKLVEQTHQNDLHLLKTTEFNRAAGIFRAAFVNEKFLLQENAKNGKKVWSEIINFTVLVAHEKAKIIFEPFVSDLQGFDKAWIKYRNTENEYEPKNLGNLKAEMSMAYLTHLEDLLKYAKSNM